MVQSRPSNIHGYYPVTSSHAPSWPPSTQFCPISRHQVSQSYSAPTYSRYEQLQVRIHENHLSYLSREETPTKLELLAKLHSLIAEFLSIVPHKFKFSFKEIGDCLSQSIKKKPDFDPKKAILAFEAIERYATNILNFPWRNEFQLIYSFSGYFRVVESSLQGVRPVLELLGFVFDASTSVFKFVELPVDPDKVSKFALECLIAIGECKMMLSIYSLAKNEFPNLTWSDIHSIRSDHICNIESSLKLLSDLKTTRLIDLDLPDYSVKKFSKLDLLSPANGVNRTLFDNNTSNNHILPPPANYMESNLDSFEFIDSKSEELVSPLSPPSTSTSFHSNRQLSSQLPQQPLPPPSSYMPTLLEPVRSTSIAPVKDFYSSSRIDSQSKYNEINTATTARTAYNYDNEKNNNSTDGQQLKKSVEKDSKKHNIIDPVMASQLANISQFDQFNRKNGLSPTAAKSKNAFPTEKKAFKVAVSGDVGNNIEGSIKNLVLGPSTDRPERGSSLVHVVNRYPKNVKQEIVPSSQEQEQGTPATVPCTFIYSTNTTTAPSTAAPSSRVPLKIKVSNLPTASVVVKLDSPGGFASSWACKSCTYINTNNSTEICKMCHKSRSLGNESMPLVSGGRECSRCTLVNAKDDMFCKACDTSLADSPTYIWWC